MLAKSTWMALQDALKARATPRLSCFSCLDSMNEELSPLFYHPQKQERPCSSVRHLLYSSCSKEKICLLKYSWSFSFAQLMLNCSKRFTCGKKQRFLKLNSLVPALSPATATGKVPGREQSQRAQGQGSQWAQGRQYGEGHQENSFCSSCFRPKWQ